MVVPLCTFLRRTHSGERQSRVAELRSLSVVQGHPEPRKRRSFGGSNYAFCPASDWQAHFSRRISRFLFFQQLSAGRCPPERDRTAESRRGQEREREKVRGRGWAIQVLTPLTCTPWETKRPGSKDRCPNEHCYLFFHPPPGQFFS